MLRKVCGVFLVLVVFHRVGGIEIENQLKVITNDCYERLAIGQRLNTKDIYKTVKANTVPKCQKECTKDGDVCKAFSFGVGVKGNSTCELGKNFIKETVDLHPIGTVRHVDFDLYIKKLGCKLVIDPKNKPQRQNSNYQQQKPAPAPAPSPSPVELPKPTYLPEKPTTASSLTAQNSTTVTVTEAYVSIENNLNPVGSNIEYGVNIPNIQTVTHKPSAALTKPSDDHIQHVKGSLVSVSPGLHSYLHPVHEILIGQKPLVYEKPSTSTANQEKNYDHNIGYFENPKFLSPFDPNYEKITGQPSIPYENHPSYYTYNRFDENWYTPQLDERSKPGYYDYNLYSEPDYRRPSQNYYGYYQNQPQESHRRPTTVGDQYKKPEIQDSYRNPLGEPQTGSPQDAYNKPLDPYRKPSHLPDSYEKTGSGYEYRKPSHHSYGTPEDDYYRKPVQNPYKEQAQKPYGESVQKPYEESAKDPYREPPQKPYGEPLQRPYGEPAQKPYKEPVQKPYGESIKYPYGEPTQKPYRESDQKPYRNSDQKPYGEPVHTPYGEPDQKPYGEPVQKPYGEHLQKPYAEHVNPYREPAGIPHRKPLNPYEMNHIHSYGNGYDERPNYYDKHPLPPFRPTHLNSPYNDERRPTITRPTSSGNYGDFNDRFDGYKPQYFRPDFWERWPHFEDTGPTKQYDKDDRRRPTYEDQRPTNYHSDERRLYPDYPVRQYDYLYASDRYDVVTNDTKYANTDKDTGKNETGGGSNGAYDDWNRSRRNQTSTNGIKPIQPIVTESVGTDGEKITSIITQLETSTTNVCFRRVLPGKRVARRFVRRSLYCERIEDCQAECADEKRFTCEGFNYRLDPTGRGKGECELLDVPLQKLDVGRDVYPDREYDYYEKDRNAAAPHCRPELPPRRPPPPYGEDRPRRPPQYPPHAYDRYPEEEYDRRRPPTYDHRRPEYDRRPNYPDYDRRPPPPEYDRRRPDYDRRRPPHGYDRPSYHDRRGDFPHYHHQHGYAIDRNDDTHHHGVHYLPPNPSLTPIIPPHDRHKPHIRPATAYGHGPDNFHRNRFDYERNNFYLPPRVGGTKDWGKYGGSYGNFGHGYESNYSWNLDENRRYDKPIVPLLPPPKSGNVLPTPLDISSNHYGPNIYNIGENLILPAEPRIGYEFLKDECSLRSVTGFRMNKRIVKKFYAVPNIYECELLCFKEREFPCASYAFRYTISLSAPADNCYLSNKNYKELDYYTDLEPDRDFDVYTMNNMNKCSTPMIRHEHDSDCFWRVRSGLRLDRRVVKDSLTVPSIVECQIECLKSRRFTCRAFGFRFGQSSPGGYVDNCQLTDWPYFELDPRTDFIPDPGFEVYERGSFGHGCEPYHFGIQGRPQKNPAIEIDQLCYVGFGSPARLLPQATKKALEVSSELDCKAECSKLREGSLFQCMSFSFKTKPKGVGPNCFLSDIYQRDLLPHIDFIRDPNHWLFAWDNYNPRCVELAHKPIHKIPQNHLDREDYGGGRYLPPGISTALDTWRSYSVSGWPCKRGHLCQENREAGFWFCKLEGGDNNAWDYCCRPDHQCGYSQGFQYPWCYVGPDKSQWRKCSERYFPYIHNLIDRYDDFHPSPNDGGAPYLPDYQFNPPQKPIQPLRPDGFRPDRPPAPPQEVPPQPSLNEYEMQFDQQFLAPPKPGGFGQPRHWPVSYLHKTMPPNISDSEPRLMKPDKSHDANSKLKAIQSLIDIINSNDLKNVEYQITNESNTMDDILFVKIPLPTNFTEKPSSKIDDKLSKSVDLKLETVDLPTVPPQSEGSTKNNTKRFSKSVDFDNNNNTLVELSGNKKNVTTPKAVYRKGYVVRTNVTTHGHRNNNKKILEEI